MNGEHSTDLILTPGLLIRGCLRTRSGEAAWLTPNPVIARSGATKQSMAPLRCYGMDCFAFGSQ